MVPDTRTIIDNVNAQAQQASQPQPAAAPHHSGNWFTHLLPTIGSVAVPLLGGLLAPETGGLSLLAAAGLSGAGAAGGKAIENAAEHKSQASDVTAGLEGAVGGLGGGILGKALGAGSKFIGRAGVNIAEKRAADTAAKDAIDSTANAYKDVNPTLQSNLGAKDAITHVNNMGFDATDPSKLIHVADTSNDILNSTLNKTLADAGPIDLSHYPDIIKKYLAEHSGTLGGFDPVALSRGRLGPSGSPAAKLLAQLENLGAGVAKTHSDPNELRDLTTKLGNLAADAKPTPTAATGAIDPAQRAVYNVINSVRNEVKTALYDRPEIEKALAAQTGNLTAEHTGTQELADHLNGVLDAAGTNGKPAAQHLLDEISRNIDISKLGKEGQRVGQIVTSKGAQARGAAEAGLDMPATGADLTNAVADGSGMIGAMKGHPIAAAGTAIVHAAQNPRILSTLSRVGDLTAKMAPAAGAVVGTAPNMVPDPVAGGTLPGGTMGDNMNPNGTNATAAPNDLQRLIQAMEAQAVLAPNLGGGASSFLSGIAPLMQHNQLLNGELSGLPASYANAGGAQGMGGILSRITSLIPGTAAHTYQAQQAAAAHQLAQAMGISPEAAAGILPQLMQNGQTAGVSQGILGNLQHQLAY